MNAVKQLKFIFRQYSYESIDTRKHTRSNPHSGEFILLRH